MLRAAGAAALAGRRGVQGLIWQAGLRSASAAAGAAPSEQLRAFSTTGTEGTGRGEGRMGGSGEHQAGMKAQNTAPADEDPAPINTPEQLLVGKHCRQSTLVQHVQGACSMGG